jgi:hypothetical protein
MQEVSTNDTHRTTLFAITAKNAVKEPISIDIEDDDTPDFLGLASTSTIEDNGM